MREEYPVSIYMKIDGVNGPITYENTKGWIELRDVEARRPIPTPGKESPGGTGIVMKYHDGLSNALAQLKPRAAIVDITIVQFDPRKTQDVERMTLREALMASYRFGPDLDTFTFSASEITILGGSLAQAIRMVRPQDWGSIQAAKVFSRGVQA
jgi:hypothetical protein